MLFFQGPYNDLTYEIIGDESAPRYFSITDEGRMNVARLLTETNLETFYVCMSVVVLQFCRN